MAGSAGRRERRDQTTASPAMPPAVAGPADSAQQRAEALSGVIPRFTSSAGEAIVNALPFVNPTSRAAQRDLGNRLVANVAGLLGATETSADSFRAADEARGDFVEATQEASAPARARRAAPAPARRGQTPRPVFPTTAELPPLTQRQVRANAAAQLSQYNVAELAALQGILPTRPEPVSVEEQVRQTLFDNATANYLRGTAPGASVEEAAAAETAFIQQLMQILDPNPLLMPTE